MNFKHTLNYFKNFLKDKKVASITPCSEYTIRRLCNKIDYGKDLVIVEYGPGSGGFTQYMLDQMTPHSRLITIEINDDFVQNLKAMQAKDPRLKVYKDGAENLAQILESEGLSQFSHVLSGIPFSLISQEDKEQILEHTYQFLEHGGKFLLYQTSYKMVNPLRHYFETINKDFESRNIPPMYLMEAIKQ